MIGTIATVASNVVEHGLGHVLYSGSPEFEKGDRVCVVDEMSRNILGDAVGTVEEVDCQFAHWEYRVVADDPEGWVANLEPETGSWLTADEIEPIAE